ncbi:MAG: SufD family Fe-S cluster assembly protein [Lachnospiraceae bacterium]|nr:SufD family Fe-S cluster assembly protein [Lachnospiraceae bacterium]
MEMDMTINRLPAPTWNWLHVNEATVKGVPALQAGRMEDETPETIEKQVISRDVWNCDNKKQPDAGTLSAELLQIPGGMGADMDQLMAKNPTDLHTWTIAAGVKESAPVRLHFTYEPDAPAQDLIGICAEEDSEITVIMDFRGADMDSAHGKLTDDETNGSKPGNTAADDRVGCEQSEYPTVSDSKLSGFAAIQTKISAKKGAKVHLVQIQRLPENFTFLNDVGTDCGEDALIDTVQVVLGGGDTYMGMRTDLGAKASSLESKVGYLLDKKEKLDLNYLAYHTGAKTTSRMDVSGVLRGESQKLFRGTIDFRNGSVGAKGDEKEDVLLFSDNVINRTVPLILCEEEDVEGNHGATIGKLDEALLFYLSSRGIAEEEIYEMMARARIDAICSGIVDEKTQELVQGYLG